VYFYYFYVHNSEGCGSAEYDDDWLLLVAIMFPNLARGMNIIIIIIIIMALQPNSGPDLTLQGFVTKTFLQGWIVSPASNPQPGGPGLRIYDPRRQGDPPIPPGTGYPF
jgi:hypothetical protein